MSWNFEQNLSKKSTLLLSEKVMMFPAIDNKFIHVDGSPSVKHRFLMTIVIGIKVSK